MKAISIGVLCGSIMGLFLWFIEHFTGVTVYRLLVNVDYLPGFKGLAIPAWMEFGLHLVVSVAVCVAADYANRNGLLGPTRRSHALRFGVIMIVIGALLFPTTILSDQAPTPLMNDSAAWGWWLFAHAGYGVIVGWWLSAPKEEQ